MSGAALTTARGDDLAGRPVGQLRRLTASMTLSGSLPGSPPERAFLNANVIRGQLTNDLLLSMAARDVFDPRWTRYVLDEMRRNRLPGVSEQKIDDRIDAMNRYFPRAMTIVPDGLEQQMRAVRRIGTFSRARCAAAPRSW